MWIRHLVFATTMLLAGATARASDPTHGNTGAPATTSEASQPGREVANPERSCTDGITDKDRALANELIKSYKNISDLGPESAAYQQGLNKLVQRAEQELSIEAQAYLIQEIANNDASVATNQSAKQMVDHPLYREFRNAQLAHESSLRNISIYNKEYAGGYGAFDALFGGVQRRYQEMTKEAGRTQNNLFAVLQKLLEDPQLSDEKKDLIRKYAEKISQHSIQTYQNSNKVHQNAEAVLEGEKEMVLIGGAVAASLVVTAGASSLAAPGLMGAGTATTVVAATKGAAIASTGALSIGSAKAIRKAMQDEGGSLSCRMALRFAQSGPEIRKDALKAAIIGAATGGALSGLAQSSNAAAQATMKVVTHKATQATVATAGAGFGAYQGWNSHQLNTKAQELETQAEQENNPENKRALLAEAKQLREAAIDASTEGIAGVAGGLYGARTLSRLNTPNAPTRPAVTLRGDIDDRAREISRLSDEGPRMKRLKDEFPELSPAQRDAVIAAHKIDTEIGTVAGGQLTLAQLRRKAEILSQADIPLSTRRELIRSGFAGHSPQANGTARPFAAELANVSDSKALQKAFSDEVFSLKYDVPTELQKTDAYKAYRADVEFVQKQLRDPAVPELSKSRYISNFRQKYGAEPDAPSPAPSQPVRMNPQQRANADAGYRDEAKNFWERAGSMDSAALRKEVNAELYRLQSASPDSQDLPELQAYRSELTRLKNAETSLDVSQSMRTARQRLGLEQATPTANNPKPATTPAPTPVVARSTPPATETLSQSVRAVHIQSKTASIDHPEVESEITAMRDTIKRSMSSASPEEKSQLLALETAVAELSKAHNNRSERAFEAARKKLQTLLGQDPSENFDLIKVLHKQEYGYDFDGDLD